METDWKLFLMGKPVSTDVVLESAGNFYLLFPQKLRPVYARKRISGTRIASTYIYYIPIETYVFQIFSSFQVLYLIFCINFSVSLIRGLHATPTFLV